MQVPAGPTLEKAAKKVGSQSYVLNCVDCGHCRDTQNPSPKDPEDVQKGRQKIIDWVDAFVKS